MATFDNYTEFQAALDDYKSEAMMFYSLRNLDDPPTEAEREALRIAEHNLVKVFIRVAGELQKLQDTWNRYL